MAVYLSAYALLFFSVFVAVVFVLALVGKVGSGMKNVAVGGMFVMGTVIIGSGLAIGAISTEPLLLQVYGSIVVALLCTFAIR